MKKFRIVLNGNGKYIIQKRKHDILWIYNWFEMSYVDDEGKYSSNFESFDKANDILNKLIKKEKERLHSMKYKIIKIVTVE